MNACLPVTLKGLSYENGGMTGGYAQYHFPAIFHLVGALLWGCRRLDHVADVVHEDAVVTGSSSVQLPLVCGNNSTGLHRILYAKDPLLATT
jgi:hypothetical protein